MRPLTPREEEVLALLCGASTPAQIAERLALAPGYVDKVIGHLRGHYRVHTTAALVAVVLNGRIADLEARLARCERDLAVLDRRNRGELGERA